MMEETQKQDEKIIKQNEPTQEQLDAAKRLSEKETELNQKAAELDQREKNMTEFMTRTQLSGKSASGQGPSKPKEETPKEYAKRVLAGKA